MWHTRILLTLLKWRYDRMDKTRFVISRDKMWNYLLVFYFVVLWFFVQMIDLYWTVIPVMLVHYFGSHPAAEYNSWRSMVVVVLTWVWAIRLTHNYLRREKWQCGAREDWRFTDMAKQHGPNWWWVSFFGVYLIQQVNPDLISSSSMVTSQNE